MATMSLAPGASGVEALCSPGKSWRGHGFQSCRSGLVRFRRRECAIQGSAITPPPPSPALLYALASPGMRAATPARSYDLPFLKGSEENTIRAAKKGAPLMAPAVITPAGIADLTSIMLRSRIIFIGQPINSQVAQRVISQLVMLAAIDEEKDIQLYINCPGGSTYSVLAIYDCMSWIKPRVGTVCFGMAASQGALILAGGTKGLRFAMPNSRVMIHQPQGGCGGTMEDVRRQVNEVVASRDKIDKMYSAFTGQPLEIVQTYTERDHFFSAAEAMEFGLIDGLLETEY
ncbi:ATP-dependent Clp protease proteolytic subunit 6, chloroplastic [Selaginella moellendorffii]|nr:ATP-dependent Clp protease proteolytic subunit 6, chloroplastic [Selaginella moellendorffii]XP_024519539.1 ATP-dependent Clp protease proteolytic subunit 6, chloroplastic [Selaginella moellendorffii]|eukprot:XP_002989989.2 ATP-dependent Clp protease proteolytic subunit 6, chloroplastic [Selaginella moellendorffii]